MQYLFRSILLFTLAIYGSCTTTRRSAPTKKDDGRLEMVFVLVNDVYEIAPVSGGKSGGMARVGTLKKEWLRRNPNTFLVMAGDFVSPSVYNSLVYQGKRIRGKQMIEAMNAAGIDFAVFGNHEFDINEAELEERINESNFKWIASNTFHKKKDSIIPFEQRRNGTISPFSKTHILSLTDADGTNIKIGFIGITLPFNKADYVSYTDPLNTAKELYAQIKDSCDAVVAITHQSLEDDIILAQQIPGLALILGGHEHDMQFEKTGDVFITKAHANAKSAYVIRLLVDKNNKLIQAIPALKMLDETVAFDSATEVAVRKWSAIAEANYASLGFDARKIAIAAGDSLDGRETQVRTRPTNLTKAIVAAMAEACPEADVAIMNAGSIRVDDILYPPITQYDILRSLPFGGPIREAEVKGSLLLQTLEAGKNNMGIGGYLHYHPDLFDSATGKWSLKGKEIDTAKIYRVAFSDFLVSGKEANLGFLHKDNPAMIRLYDAESKTENSKSDLRLAIVRYFEKVRPR